jgi:AhpD family alkylhydroperoxidase
MSHYRELLDEVRDPAVSLRNALPEVWAGFTTMHNATMTDGHVPARLKEAAALAISVVKGCEGCISHHARRAARLGATEGEVAEMLAVALLMDGGPATVHGPHAWAAFQEFRAVPPSTGDSSPGVAHVA